MSAFFDPTKLSDEELEKKEEQLHMKLAWAANYGGSALITGLRTILDAIEAEKYERYNQLIAKVQRELPQVIESDPDLAAQHKRKEEVKKEEIDAKKKILVTKINIPRTSEPVIEKKDQ